MLSQPSRMGQAPVLTVRDAPMVFTRSVGHGRSRCSAPGTRRNLYNQSLLTDGNGLILTVSEGLERENPCETSLPRHCLFCWRSLPPQQARVLPSIGKKKKPRYCSTTVVWCRSTRLMETKPKSWIT